MDIISIFIVLFIAIIPFLITVLNIIRLTPFFTMIPFSAKLKGVNMTSDMFALIGGAFLFVTLHDHIAGGDWHEAINPVLNQFHNVLSFEYVLTWGILAILCTIALILLRIKKETPPLVTVALYSFVYIGMILSVFLMIQLWENIGGVYGGVNDMVLYLFLYPLNFLLISLIVLKNSIEDKNNEQKTKIGKIVFKLRNSWAWGFVFLIPICGILIMILAIFGQRPDAIIGAFTETAGWTFSQRIPPPPLDHTGHYLCTVAAKGNPKIVKPLFVGKRHDKPIIVNRQLQVANAFEDLITEKLPRTHKVLRGFYDKYGYPISRHINKPLGSSVTYIIMKPIEWVFLLILYTFDIKPENRIQRQYR